MEILSILMAILMGGIFILIRSFNMLLGKNIGIYASNLINHMTGVVGSFIIYMLVLFSGIQIYTGYSNIPLYAFTGGIIGSSFMVLSNYSFSKTTVITSTTLILCGQFISSLLVDIFIPKIHITPTNVVGAILVVIGTILYSQKSSTTGKIVNNTPL